MNNKFSGMDDFVSKAPLNINEEKVSRYKTKDGSKSTSVVKGNTYVQVILTPEERKIVDKYCKLASSKRATVIRSLALREIRKQLKEED